MVGVKVPLSLVHHWLMPLFSFEGLAPVVSPAAWIAPTATLVGDVRVEDEASVWYGAVLRADLGPIIVRAGANIQDGSVLHGGGDPACEVGEGATIGHLCVIHGARIGAEALIGNGATVLDGAVIGRRALVAAGAHFGYDYWTTGRSPPQESNLAFPTHQIELPTGFRRGCLGGCGGFRDPASPASTGRSAI